MARITTVDQVPAGTPMAVSLRSTRDLVTGTWRTARPDRTGRPSPCNLACPAGTDVRGWLQLAADGDIEGAWRTMLEHNPLPGICGRVCDHPCERGCNRTALDEAVAVQAIERSIADEARRRHLRVERPGPSAHARHVAVIGAGPAGMSCAYHLARRGHLPTMFDAMPAAGGRLRYGVPSYRLPRAVLEAELDTLWHLGVGFQGNARFGSTLTWEDLSAYAAVLVAVGANQPKRAGVDGESLDGVQSGWEFLRGVNSGAIGAVDGHVVVIGGGEIAIAAARTALRLGASRVTVAYRRSREQMPADADDVAQAEAEGIVFAFEVTPAAFKGEHGRLAGVEFLRTHPGQPGHARPRPDAIPGSAFILPAAHALTAIGQGVDVEAFTPVVDTDAGRIYADLWGRTTLPAIFAGGAAAMGAGSVVSAIGSGRVAAEAIDAWLAGREPVETRVGGGIGPADLNFFYFRRAPRATSGRLAAEHARRGMDEVVQGLPWRDAVREARRCLTCGSCTECDNCLTFCPEGAVRHDRRARTYLVDGAHCKGCGICVAECPRGAVVLVPEEPC
jgi:NADPH-dependent glutamate synthase beta subunit-like oxidoreductase/Pyruvate/2-oxoacid:ferredoxin oxidoreductase delta subunit